MPKVPRHILGDSGCEPALDAVKELHQVRSAALNCFCYASDHMLEVPTSPHLLSSFRCLIFKVDVLSICVKMDSLSNLESTSRFSVPRSSIQHTTRVDECFITTVNDARVVDDSDISTADVPALPFIVTQHFHDSDPDHKSFYHLFPDNFPTIEEDIGHGAPLSSRKPLSRE